MVTDAVECLDAEIEGFKNDVGAPDGMVIAARDEGIEGVLAGMTSGAVPAVVAERYGLGERNIEPKRTSNGCGDLCDLKGVCEPCPLVIVGKDEHLGLARETTESGRVQDAVAITFEARTELVGLLGAFAVAGPHRAGGESTEHGVLGVFPRLAGNGGGLAGSGPRIGVRERDSLGGVGSGHGARPTLGSLLHVAVGLVHVSTIRHRCGVDAATMLTGKHRFGSVA